MSSSIQATDYIKMLAKNTINYTDIFKLIKDPTLPVPADTISIIIEKTLFYNSATNYSKKCLEKCTQAIINVKNNKRKKVSASMFSTPMIEKYENIIIYNYSVAQLKSICRRYGQRISGNKDELQNKLFFYLLRSADTNIIQHAWRRYIRKKYHILRGPARYNRKLCVNETDFCTMEDIEDISYAQFFSYKDTDDKIYGFDLMSIYTLLSKGNAITSNPYNRIKIPRAVRKNINTILRIASLMKKKINIHIEEPEEVSPQKQIEQRTINIFHDMDLLGNYTHSEWFTSLGRAALIRFIRELADIWMYRAQLSELTQREICPPHGKPFGDILHSLLSLTTEMLKSQALTIMEKMVKHGVNHASQCLGTNYILCAFTLVNNNARDSLPWLYQSVI